jgi:hypothetical protein
MSERFYRKVRQEGEGGCHVWTGAHNVWGYGRLKIGGKMYSAHRVAWEFTNGPIPGGLFVLHRCDNRHCVNPEHLFLGTQLDNVHDMHAKNRQARRGARRNALPSLRSSHMSIENPTRLEIILPAARKAELDTLAKRCGIPSGGLARLAIIWMLNNPSALTGGKAEAA